MSMKHYPVCAVGLLVYEHELYDISERLDVCTDDLQTAFGGCSIDVDGGFTPLKEGKEELSFNEEMVLIASPLKAESLFERAYEDYDELLNEYKERFGKYFLEDFDWDSRIGYLSGTTFG